MPATKSKPAAKPAKPAPAKTKAKPVAKPAAAPAPKRTTKPTPAEQEASDAKFYGTLEKHGVQIDNPKTGKRLSRFILQAHCLAECWPAKPLTPQQIAELCTTKFGINITAKRVERQLIDEVRCGRVVAKGKGYVKTGVVANYHSLAAAE